MTQQNSPTNTGKTVGIGLGALLMALPIVAYFEGFMPRTYVDPVGIPTVCFGETNKTITMQDRFFSREECTAMLSDSLRKHAAEISKCVKVPVWDHEAAAILSWGYNVGSTAACQSTLIAKLNRGESAGSWCPELHRWVYAGGKKLNGLVKRREAEYQMCIGSKV